MKWQELVAFLFYHFLLQWRSWLWSTIEYPWTSSLAQFLACFSLFMVFIMVMVMVMVME